MRQPTGDHCIGKTLSRGNPDTLLIEERAFAALGNEHLLVRRVVDQPCHHRGFALERNRDGELGNTVEKIRGAIERIDDPVMRLVGAFALAAFLTEKAVTGPRLHQFRVQCFLGAAVGGRHEIAGTLQRNLQFLQLAKVAFKRARGLARGGDHDVKQSGGLHDACGLPVMARVVKGGRVPRSTAISWRPCRRRRARPAFACRRKRRDRGRSRRRPSQSYAI